MFTLRSLCILTAAAAMAVAQTTPVQERTLRLRNAATAQDRNEIFTALTVISDVKRMTTDPGAADVIFQGTEDQLRAAEWVIGQLDLPPNVAPTAGAVFRTTERGQDQVVRVFALPQSETPQAFNETQTAVRTMTDIRRVYPYVSRRTVVIRGSLAEMELAEWLMAEMYRTSSTGVRPFEAAADKDTHVQVLHYWRGDVTDFNEAQTAMRTLTDIRRVYPHSARGVMAVRGTREQVGYAAWLVEEFGRDFRGTAPQVAFYTAPGGEVANVFHFPADTKTEDLLARLQALRGAGIRRVGVLQRSKIATAAGTPAQMSQAATLIIK